MIPIIILAILPSIKAFKDSALMDKPIFDPQTSSELGFSPSLWLYFHNIKRRLGKTQASLVFLSAFVIFAFRLDLSRNDHQI